MNKFRYIPAFVSLFAGFVGSVIMIIHKYSLVEFLWILVSVIFGFYLAGLLLRFLLNKAFNGLEEKKNSKNESDDQNADENINISQAEQKTSDQAD